MALKYFLDTEFHEKQGSIELISIGIVCEDMRTLYLVNKDYNWKTSSDWLLKNVRPSLDPSPRFVFQDVTKVELSHTLSLPEIREKVIEFCDTFRYGCPEFWGYYAAYDWIVFCWLFGSMMDLPKGYPMYINDIKSFQEVLKPDYKFKRKGESKHNALEDALEVQDFYSQIFNQKGE